MQFTRDHALQRDCEVEVHSVDRVGNFQGSIRIGRINLGGEWGGLGWVGLLAVGWSVGRLQSGVTVFSV